ncbi:MAG: glycoside hydrolase N-terminal domain-containing protein, partial [Flavobacterium sp.]
MQSNSFYKLLVFFAFALFCGKITAQSNHVLWYDKPAEYFEESLVLGNGKLGATVFGGVNSDKIYL